MTIKGPSTATKIQLLVVYYHLLFIFGLSVGSWSWCLLGIISYLLFGKIGAEIGLHRYFAHRSFETAKWKDRTLLVFATLAGLGSPISWAATHRLHHQFSDTPKDPHSPLFQTPWRVWLTLWTPFLVPQRTVADLAGDSWQKVVHRHYFKIHFCLNVFLFLIHPLLPCFILAWPSVIAFHIAGAVNVLCHVDELKNHQWVNLFALGDALHKNHHAQASSSSNNFTGSGIDISAWIIRNILQK